MNTLPDKIIRHMKYFFLLIFAMSPFVVSASAIDFLVVEDYLGFLKSISLWSAILVASMTSVMIWWGGRQMRGGVFGSVFVYFSVGMTLVFAGFVASNALSGGLTQAPYLEIAHNSLFIVGYVFMGFGANKLLKTVKGE